MHCPIWVWLYCLIYWLWRSTSPALAQERTNITTLFILEPSQRLLFVDRSTESEFETDRDAFTPSTRAAGRGCWIGESSYSLIDHRHVPETHSFPELLLRYGISERIEVRLGYNIEIGGGGNAHSGFVRVDRFEEPTIEKGQRFLYGIKAQLTEQCRLLPESSVIIQGYTPIAKDDTDTQLAATYAFGWALENRWKVDAAIRCASSGLREDDFNVWASSIVLRIPLGDRWAVHGEYVGFFSQGKALDFVQHYFTPGVHVLITPDVEVGVRVGAGLNQQSDRFFCNAGIGWRF